MNVFSKCLMTGFLMALSSVASAGIYDVRVKGVYINDNGNTFLCAMQADAPPTGKCPSSGNENCQLIGSDYAFQLPMGMAGGDRMFSTALTAAVSKGMIRVNTGTGDGCTVSGMIGGL